MYPLCAHCAFLSTLEINHLNVKSRHRWLDPLKSLIGRVDEKFSTFFRDMGCAGEISLLEDKDNVRYYTVYVSLCVACFNT